MPRHLIPHRASTNSAKSIDSETDSIITATTNELIEVLTRTLQNINHKSKHILKVEDCFGVHQITAEGDKINRFLRQLENGHRLQTMMRLRNLTIIQIIQMTKRPP